jgi:NADH-ubiquinone oxidoreductase chain 6
MKNFLINILALGVLVSSILVITSKNPIICVLFLISVFLNAAGYLIMSGIGFIGISYIIVYIGAIAVLFLFVIMMINIRLTDIIDTGNQYTKTLPLALCIGSLFIFEIFTILPFSFNNLSFFIPSILNFESGDINSGYSFDLLNSLNGIFLNTNLLNNNVVFFTNNTIIADTTFTNFLQIEAIGQGLYTYGAFLLILSSVILLLAMVAPIFISLRNPTLP